MAGRYDPNPFDEEEVNPFIVSLCPFFYFYAKFVFFLRQVVEFCNMWCSFGSVYECFVGFRSY
jgi:hypothetical protein